MTARRPDEVEDLLVTVLRDAGLDVDDVADRRHMTMLSGEHKRTIPVLFEVGDQTLAVTSLFATELDEGHGEVYALLLHRNDRARLVHFALDDADQLVLVGRIPLAAVDEALLGELLGELLTTADTAFNAVLRAGFRSYIEVEQSWREQSGLPPNPVTGQK